MTRYLSLVGNGAVLIPVEEWIPFSLKKVLNMVTGIEYDKLDGAQLGNPSNA